MVSGEKTVAGCRFRVAGYKFQVAGLREYRLQVSGSSILRLPYCFPLFEISDHMRELQMLLRKGRE
jgi:hypothetical protein